MPGVVTPALPSFSTLSLWGIALVKIKTKVSVAAGILLASVFCVWYMSTGQSSATTEAPASTGPMVVTLPGQEEEDTPPAPERSPVELEERTESQTAGLVVHTTWRETGEPAANVGIRLQEGWGSLGHYASTDESGTARFEGLEPGSFDLTMDRLIPDGRSWDLELEAGDSKP